MRHMLCVGIVLSSVIMGCGGGDNKAEPSPRLSSKGEVSSAQASNGEETTASFSAGGHQLGQTGTAPQITNAVFLASLFTTYLKRDAGVEEFNYHYKRLQFASVTRARLEKEFQDCAERTVLELYETLLERKPNMSERFTHQARLAQNQVSKRGLENEIKASNEAYVLRLFRLYIGRLPYSMEERRAHFERLDNKILTRPLLEVEFYNCPEAVAYRSRQ